MNKKLGRLIVWSIVFALSMLGAHLGLMEQEKGFFVIIGTIITITLTILFVLGLIEWKLSGDKGYVLYSLEAISITLIFFGVIYVIALIVKKDFFEVFQLLLLLVTILIPQNKKEEEQKKEIS